MVLEPLDTHYKVEHGRVRNGGKMKNERAGILGAEGKNHYLSVPRQRIRTDGRGMADKNGRVEVQTSLTNSISLWKHNPSSSLPTSLVF